MSRLIKLGPYELLDRIAIGGMAEIYLSRVVGLHQFERIFVLKLIHPKYVGDSEFMRMFIDEAKLVAQLHHSNIAQVFDLGHSEDNYFIVMEYVHGRDLSEILEISRDAQIPIPVSVCLSIASQMLCGLYYAHSKTDDRGRSLNIVHRDVTPQNILVSFFGETKILDFGVAKAAMSARPETQAGIIKGKFKYMSPEQAWGDRLDGRSDLFSAALLLYEMLSGISPYDAEGEINPRQTIMKMREAKIPPISHMRSDVPKGLDDVLTRALARDRDQRFPTALDFQISVAEVLAKSDPGFSNADTMEYLRKLFPRQTQEANLPISRHPRFGSIYRREKDPSDARTLEVEDAPEEEVIAADFTVPVDTSGGVDATDETVSMVPLDIRKIRDSDSHIELDLHDLQQVDDDPDATHEPDDDDTVHQIPKLGSSENETFEAPKPDNLTSDTADTDDRYKKLPKAIQVPDNDQLETFQNQPLRRPTASVNQPAFDLAIQTTERPTEDWLEVFPENVRPTVLTFARRASEILGLAPQRAFVTAVVLLMLLGLATFFALIAIFTSI